MRIQGEISLVTGAGRGIGRAIALRFAREGADLILAGRTMRDLESVREEITALGRQTLAIACDISDDSAIRSLVRRGIERFGKIDSLINNAGYYCANAPLQEMPDEEWDRTLRVNLTGTFYVCRTVVPEMIKCRRGSIVMMSSIASKAAFPFSAPYAAAKTGLLGLTRALAAELGPHGIRVNALCPGVVTGTEMHAAVNREVQKMTGVAPEERVSGARNMALLRMLPSPEDVAEAALFLCSPLAAAITGQSLNVDGGVCFS
jgi:3-oxoacyl-[acyl-carrier protein] reductase